MTAQLRSPGMPQAGRWPLERWCAATALSSVPLAAAPVAFSLVSLSVTGEVRGGAAMILAMTAASVLGAVPITRAGRRFAPVSCFRILVAVRVAALLAMTVAAVTGAAFGWFLVAALLLGSVHGAAYGILRSLLAGIVPGSGFPRALGIAATLNELVFVISPVLASLLGAVSPAAGLAAMTVAGVLPVLLVPAPRLDAMPAVPARGRGRVIARPVLFWLAVAAAGGFAVAAIEIGAVALALSYGHDATMAVLFTIPLCVASVSGGIWVSVRNRPLDRIRILAALALTTAGAGLSASGGALGLTVLGAVLVGLCLAPLGTAGSLALENLAPGGRKPEVFALQRTAHALGIIGASAILAFAPVSAALAASACLMAAVTLWAGLDRGD